MINCIVIDDEELARKLIENHINRIDFLQVSGLFDSPLKAIETLNKEAIDLVFLDIQMPDLKGTDFAKMIQGKAQVIFTTAYSEYALEGFDLDAVDYLLKPITFERFLKAVNKVNIGDRAVTNEFITVKSGYDLHKIKLKDILFVKSDSEYVVFHMVDKKIMSYQSLKSLEETLPSKNFMRVHRSFIINKNQVQSLKDKDLLINGNRIPVSATYFDAVKSALFS